MAIFRFLRIQLLVGLFIFSAGAVPMARAVNPERAKKWKVEVEGEDVWLKLSAGGSNTFALRLGAGGAISEIKGGGKSLLSPSFQGEVTDRVIQWTIWSDTVTNRVASLPKNSSGDLTLRKVVVLTERFRRRRKCRLMPGVESWTFIPFPKTSGKPNSAR